MRLGTDLPIEAFAVLTCIVDQGQAFDDHVREQCGLSADVLAFYEVLQLLLDRGFVERVATPQRYAYVATATGKQLVVAHVNRTGGAREDVA